MHGFKSVAMILIFYALWPARIAAIKCNPSAKRFLSIEIDECFLDFTGFHSIDLTGYGQAIRQRVLQWLGLPVCVGIGPSKTLAKLANHVAKKREQHQGVFDYSLLGQQEQDELLSGIEVGEVWGIGRRLSERLARMGIATVKDLRDADTKTVRRQFSVVVERTVLELRGVSCLDLEEVAQAKQEIVSSRSFGKLAVKLDDLQQAVASYTARAAEKLRRMETLDHINRKMGRGTLRLAAEGFQHAWKIRTDYPSPRYTTRWAELPVAYAK